MNRFLPFLAIMALFLAIGCQNTADTGGTTDQPDDSSDNQDSEAVDAKYFGTACDIGDPIDAAFSKVGYDEESNSAVIPGGFVVTPYGKTVNVRRYAWGVAFSPDGSKAYVTNAEGGQATQVIDLSSEEGPVTGTSIAFPSSHGIAVSSDGSKVYVAGGNTGTFNTFGWEEDAFVKQDSFEVIGYVGSVVLSPDNSTLYTISPTQSNFAKIVLPDNEPQKVKVGHYPQEVILSLDGSKAYVSCLGDNSVYVIDTASLNVDAIIEVEEMPQGLALVENDAYLLVANSGVDTISVIDIATSSVIETIFLSKDNPELISLTPTHIVAHPDPSAHRAYVAVADQNSVNVIDTESWTIIGAIPTAYYPTRLAITNDGSKIAVINSKGWGSRPGEKTGAGLYGVFQILDTPANAAELETLTRQVNENYETPKGFYPDNECERIVPLPLSEDEKSVIEHVILVIKENKTYDEILGDLVGPEGDEWHDPALAVKYGEKATMDTGDEVNVTPNAHAISRRWVDFVNFYSNPEVSLQGHMWTTQADCNDFVERTRFDRTPATGVDPLTLISNGSIFEHLAANDVNFRVYGEVVNFGPDKFDDWIDKIDLKYPEWSTGLMDITKAKEVIREWDLAVETGDERLFPPFIYIVLPNDHTVGGRAGMPHPQSMVADNDHGLGMLVDWLSKSPFWENSLLISIQDDPQSSFGDHIDAHRSLCYFASPWVKRGYRSTVNYSIPSIYRTIELILGIPPLNRNTYMAPPMVDIFTDEADTSKYDAIEPTMPIVFNPETGKFAEEAKKWDWSTYDDHDGLGDHNYRYMMGDIPRPDYVKRIDD